MTSFVELAIALLIGAGVSGPAAGGAPTVTPGPCDSLAAVVRSQVAARWSVPADSVELEWSSVPAESAEATALTGVGRVLGGGGGWFTVVATAAGEAHALRFRAGVRTTVPVALRALNAGERLSTADFDLETRLVHGTPAPEARRPDAGWQARRPIAIGEALAWPALTPPQIIGPGQPVTVAWRRGAVEVRLDGVALQAARTGDTVPVRITGREGRMTAIAVAPGLVRLEGGTP
jgi:flagella basal body P-ring formation protein FlgA